MTGRSEVIMPVGASCQRISTRATSPVRGSVVLLNAAPAPISQNPVCGLHIRDANWTFRWASPLFTLMQEYAPGLKRVPCHARGPPDKTLTLPVIKIALDPIQFGEQLMPALGIGYGTTG